MASPTRHYKPGTLAPVSGIYLAFHGEEPRRQGDPPTHFEHRPPHQVMVIRGEELPSCRICKQAARFEIVEVVSYMCHDIDFAGLSTAALEERFEFQVSSFKTQECAHNRKGSP